MAAANSVITQYRRENLVKITSGAISAIPKIKYIALGSGGVNASGEIIPPSADSDTLATELGRYEVGAPAYPVATTARYSIVVPEGDLPGARISEIGLLDEAGKACAKRSCSPKIKDGDEEFSFTFDDEF